MKYKHLFGPVPSRRLGVSLGIDLIEHKTCNLDCVYCECGKTTNHTMERKEYVKADEVLDELRDYLKENPYLDFITFAGSGEPTLNSKIGYIIDEIKKMTNTKIALITNGVNLNEEGIIDEIKKCDVIIPSLDALSEDVFQKINRPYKNLKIEEIKTGLLKLREKYEGDIYLEIFILDGINNTEDELFKFKEFIKKMKVEKIQLNSLDRPPVETWVKKADIEVLENIKKYFEMENVEIVTKYKDRKLIKSYNKDIEDLIMNMLEKRPCTIEDIGNISQKSKAEINKYLDVLEKEKKIKTEFGERGIYIRKII